MTHMVENTLEADLRKTLNKYSADARANTPDFVLAQFLTRSLNAFTDAVQQRDAMTKQAMKQPPNKKEDTNVAG